MTVVSETPETVARSTRSRLRIASGIPEASTEASSTSSVVNPAAASWTRTVTFTRPSSRPAPPMTKSLACRTSLETRVKATRGCCCTSI